MIIGIDSKPGCFFPSLGESHPNMSGETDPNVLIVDDDPQVRDVYVMFLEDSYPVLSASSGEEALELLTDEIDVVLLDRRMPDMSGDEVLEVIRERGYDCRVAMVTAVKPEIDVIEMGFDDYVTKPVTRSKIVNVVDSLYHWDEYDDVLQRYFEVARKVTILEENPGAALQSNPKYRQLKEQLSALRAEADELVDGTDSGIVDGFFDPAEEGGSARDPTSEIGNPP